MVGSARAILSRNPSADVVSLCQARVGSGWEGSAAPSGDSWELFGNGCCGARMVSYSIRVNRPRRGSRLRRWWVQDWLDEGTTQQHDAANDFREYARRFTLLVG